MARCYPLPTGSVVVPEPIIRVEGITKSFGDVHALQGVDLEVANSRLARLTSSLSTWRPLTTSRRPTTQPLVRTPGFHAVVELYHSPQ